MDEYFDRLDEDRVEGTGARLVAFVILTAIAVVAYSYGWSLYQDARASVRPPSCTVSPVTALEFPSGVVICRGLYPPKERNVNDIWLDTSANRVTTWTGDRWEPMIWDGKKWARR